MCHLDGYRLAGCILVTLCLALGAHSTWGQDDDSGNTLVIYDHFDEDGNLVDGAFHYETIDLSAISSLMGTSGGRNVETVLSGGPPCNRLDLVMVGDGYTEDELDTYADHVDALLDMFDVEPLASYKNFFNVHRVDVISDESGVDNDPTDGIEVDTALNMGFWCGGVERALCISTAAALAAAGAAPESEQVLALANSTKYGGTAQPSNDLAMVSGGNGSRVEVAIHEIGHSLGDLADEYTYGGSPTYTGSEPSAANVSIYEYDEMEDDERKWWQWLGNSGTGFDGEHDTYEGANYSASGIYRPTNNSKMRNLGRPFNLVSAEALILKIYGYVNPIDRATLTNTPLHGCSEVWIDVVDPIGHDMEVEWSLDGEVIDGETGYTISLGDLELEVGEYTLMALVVDNTDWVVDEDARETWMTESREWDIIVTDEDENDVPDGCEDLSAVLQLWDVCQQVGPLCGSSGNLLGGAVALDGDHAFAGARLADTAGTNSGLVLSYEFDTVDDEWKEGPALDPSLYGAGDQFGNSMAISGSYLAVGAHLADDEDAGNDSGAAYVFRLSAGEWSEQARLLGDTTVGTDRFGTSVDIDGAVLVAGAIRDDDDGSNSGSAFVFRRSGSTWSQEVQLDPEELTASDLFGTWVAIDSDVIVVGAPADDTGAVYVFRHDDGDWPQEQRLSIEGLDEGARFGETVDVRDGWIAVGAPNTDGDVTNGGSIFMFQYDDFDSTWTEYQELTTSDVTESARFGQRLVLHARGLVAQAPGDIETSGSLYSFKYDDDLEEWLEIDKSRAPDAEPFDNFGSGISIDGDTMFVGSHRDDVGGLSSGSGYFMHYGPELTAYPESMALCDGDLEILTVETDASGVDFQWQKDGEDIPGETEESLVLVNVDATDAGTYRCVLTEGCGLSISPPATITISEVAPEIVSVTVDVELLEITVSSELLGDGLDILWDLGDGTTTTESEFTHTYDQDGSYSLELTISNGCGDDESTTVVNVGDTQFIRGDVDGNGETFPIVDALYLLDYGFTNGPLPPCLDAADVDGNNQLFPIIDAMYLLEYGFTNGPAPPDPGGEECGADPNDDDIDCVDASACA